MLKDHIIFSNQNRYSCPLLSWSIFENVDVCKSEFELVVFEFSTISKESSAKKCSVIISGSNFYITKVDCTATR